MLRLSLIIACLILLAVDFCSGQTNEQDSVKKRNPYFYPNELFISPVVSIDYSYRRLKHEISDDGLDIAEYFTDIFDSIESPRLSYSVGLMFDYNFTYHFGLEGGFLFSDKGRKQNATVVLFTHDYYWVITNPVKEKTHFYYLDVPLGVNFKSQLGRYPNDLGISGGLLWETLLAKREIEFLYYGDGISQGNVEIDSVVKAGAPFINHKLGFYVATSIDFSLATYQRISLRFTPWFRYALYSWNGQKLFSHKQNQPTGWDFDFPKDDPLWDNGLSIDDLPYSFGIRADLKFRLSKYKPRKHASTFTPVF